MFGDSRSLYHSQLVFAPEVDEEILQRLWTVWPVTRSVLQGEDWTQDLPLPELYAPNHWAIGAVMYYIISYHIILYYIIAYYIIVHYIIACYIILGYSIAYHTISYRIVLCWGPRPRSRDGCEAVLTLLLHHVIVCYTIVEYSIS